MRTSPKKANDRSCAICLETVLEQGRIECCSHMFCFVCIVTWANVTNTCPLCKRRFGHVEQYAADGAFLDSVKVEDKEQLADDEVPLSALVEEETPCMVCGSARDEGVLLLCDGCNNACHTYCCHPALESVPEGDWFCHTCEQRGNHVHRARASAAARRARLEELSRQRRQLRYIQRQHRRGDTPDSADSLPSEDEQPSRPGRKRRRSSREGGSRKRQRRLAEDESGEARERMVQQLMGDVIAGINGRRGSGGMRLARASQASGSGSADRAPEVSPRRLLPASVSGQRSGRGRGRSRVVGGARDSNGAWRTARGPRRPRRLQRRRPSHTPIQGSDSEWEMGKEEIEDDEEDLEYDEDEEASEESSDGGRRHENGTVSRNRKRTVKCSDDEFDADELRQATEASLGRSPASRKNDPEHQRAFARAVALASRNSTSPSKSRSPRKSASNRPWSTISSNNPLRPSTTTRTTTSTVARPSWTSAARVTSGEGPADGSHRVTAVGDVSGPVDWGDRSGAVDQGSGRGRYEMQHSASDSPQKKMREEAGESDFPSAWDKGGAPACATPDPATPYTTARVPTMLDLVTPSPARTASDLMRSRRSAVRRLDTSEAETSGPGPRETSGAGPRERTDSRCEVQHDSPMEFMFKHRDRRPVTHSAAPPLDDRSLSSQQLHQPRRTRAADDISSGALPGNRLPSVASKASTEVVDPDDAMFERALVDVADQAERHLQRQPSSSFAAAHVTTSTASTAHVTASTTDAEQNGTLPRRSPRKSRLKRDSDILDKYRALPGSEQPKTKPRLSLMDKLGAMAQEGPRSYTPVLDILPGSNHHASAGSSGESGPVRDSRASGSHASGSRASDEAAASAAMTTTTAAALGSPSPRQPDGVESVIVRSPRRAAAGAVAAVENPFLQSTPSPSQNGGPSSLFSRDTSYTGRSLLPSRLQPVPLKPSYVSISSQVASGATAARAAAPYVEESPQKNTASSLRHVTHSANSEDLVADSPTLAPRASDAREMGGEADGGGGRRSSAVAETPPHANPSLPRLASGGSRTGSGASLEIVPESPTGPTLEMPRRSSRLGGGSLTNENVREGAKQTSPRPNRLGPRKPLSVVSS